jgi:hypothetical protein
VSKRWLILAGIFLLLIVAAGVGFWQHRRHERFLQRVDDARSTVNDLIGKTDADSTAYALADDRAQHSLRELEHATYTDSQSVNSLLLNINIDILHTCRDRAMVLDSGATKCIADARTGFNKAFDKLNSQ